MDKWTLVLRDQAGVELRINIDATVEAMPGGTNLNMNDMQYLGIFSESLGADVCGVTVPSEQQVIEYFGDMFNDRDERANKRLNGHTRPQDNFRDLGN